MGLATAKMAPQVARKIEDFIVTIVMLNVFVSFEVRSQVL